MMALVFGARLNATALENYCVRRERLHRGSALSTAKGCMESVDSCTNIVGFVSKGADGEDQNERRTVERTVSESCVLHL